VSVGRGSPRNSGVPPAARGAALIGLAVIVGIIGLQVLDDSTPGGSQVTVPTSTTTTATSAPATTAAAGATTTTAKPATTAASGAATTTTTAKTKKNSDVKVVVYNASGINGMAANMNDKLKSAGYNSTVGGNLSPVRTGTTVQCRAGLDAEATKLATQGVGNGATVTPFPSNPPKGSDQADCIVVLGKQA
jgi:hypothetical protein